MKKPHIESNIILLHFNGYPEMYNSKSISSLKDAVQNSDIRYIFVNEKDKFNSNSLICLTPSDVIKLCNDYSNIDTIDLDDIRNSGIFVNYSYMEDSLITEGSPILTWIYHMSHNDATGSFVNLANYFRWGSQCFDICEFLYRVFTIEIVFTPVNYTRINSGKLFESEGYFRNNVRSNYIEIPIGYDSVWRPVIGTSDGGILIDSAMQNAFAMINDNWYIDVNLNGDTWHLTQDGDFYTLLDYLYYIPRLIPIFLRDISSECSIVLSVTLDFMGGKEVKVSNSYKRDDMSSNDTSYISNYDLYHQLKQQLSIELPDIYKNWIKSFKY